MPFRQPQLSHEITFLEHFEVFDCFTRIFQYFIVLFSAGNQIFSLFLRCLNPFLESEVIFPFVSFANKQIKS